MAKEDDTRPTQLFDAIASVDGMDNPPPNAASVPPTPAVPQPAIETQAMPAAAPAAEPPAPAAAVPEPLAGGQQKPDGVLTKDGKHVIPYDVLEQARRDLGRTEQENQALKAKLQEFTQAQAQVAAGQPVEIPDISKLKAEYPEELWKPLEAMQTQLVALQSQTVELKADLAQREQERQDSAIAGYNADVSQVPELAEINKTEGPLKAQAIEISKRLLADPDYKPANRAEHFKDVVKELKAAKAAELKLLGFAIPDPAAPAAATPAPPARPLPSKDVPPPPASLSDIPGGTAPAATEAEGFANMNDIDAVAMMVNAKQKGGDNGLNALLRRTYR